MTVLVTTTDKPNVPSLNVPRNTKQTADYDKQMPNAAQPITPEPQGTHVAWDRTTILTTTQYASQLDLTEHAAIKMRDPILNRTSSVSTCSSQWDPVLPKIVKSFRPRSAGITLPLIWIFLRFSVFVCLYIYK